MATIKSKKPRPEKADSERDEMTDSESGPARCPTPPPRSPTPPSTVKKSTAKKPDRRSTKLTEVQQDIMFEWLEQTPAIYDTNHDDYKRRIQLFGEQTVRMGDGLDGTTLELWFKSCRTGAPSSMVHPTRRGCGPRCPG